MIWWDWNVGKRLALVATILLVAVVPLILVGGFGNNWGALAGGAAFLLIPQLVAWMLFVGLRTGRMPSAYGRSELRTESPRWFWLTGATYAGLLVLFLWIILGVVILDL